MNTAIYSPTGASSGIGFAIPVDTVKAVADRLIKFGETIRPVLGITFLEAAQVKRCPDFLQYKAVHRRSDHQAQGHRSA